MKRHVKFVLVGDERDIPEGMNDGDESIFGIDEGKPMLVGRVKHVDFLLTRHRLVAKSSPLKTRGKNFG